MINVTTSELFKRENLKWWPALLLHFLTYYTTFNFIIVLLYKFTAPYIDLHLSALITAFVSFGICFIHPREWIIPLDDEHQMYISVKDGDIYVYARDIFVHWVPVILVFLLVPIKTSYAKTTCTFFLSIFYLVFFNAPDLYGFDMYISLVLAILAMVVRFALSACL